MNKIRGEEGRKNAFSILLYSNELTMVLEYISRDFVTSFRLTSVYLRYYLRCYDTIIDNYSGR